MAELVGGCTSKKIWDQMCANMLDLENAMLEEIEAGLDPDFVPEGWREEAQAVSHQEEDRVYK